MISSRPPDRACITIFSSARADIFMSLKNEGLGMGRGGRKGGRRKVRRGEGRGGREGEGTLGEGRGGEEGREKEG